VLRGAGTLATEEWPRPKIGEGELLLRLRGCGLCGSDIAKIVAPRTSAPQILGHEVVGEVVAAGAGAPFALGERVVAAHEVVTPQIHDRLLALRAELVARGRAGAADPAGAAAAETASAVTATEPALETAAAAGKTKSASSETPRRPREV